MEQHVEPQEEEMKRRVAITGIGVISTLGITQDTVTESLWAGISGVVASSKFRELKFRSGVHAPIHDELPHIDRRIMRHMGNGETLLLGYHALLQAVADSGLSKRQISHRQTGCILGTGGPSTLDQTKTSEALYADGEKRTWQRRVGPLAVVPTMNSGLQAKSANDLRIKGVNFSITSACATSAHCIGEAALKIVHGYQCIMFAGGSDDCHETKACGFDANGTLATVAEGDDPTAASKPYDVSRNGFVDGAGGGILVLEEHEHAKRRGARIYGEIIGYGLSGDGDGDMTAPGFEGPKWAMQLALRGLHTRVRGVGYVNAHGTSTGAGDVNEVRVIQAAFARRNRMPWIASTKSLTGHALGGAGALEAIYTILMLRANFIAASAHIDEIDPELIKIGMDQHIVRKRIDNADIRVALSNSFGFGGTNACLALRVAA